MASDDQSLSTLAQRPIDLASVVEAMAYLAHSTRDPSIRRNLGAGLTTELATVAAAFRQRFPHLWPDAQRQLPLA